MFPFLLLLLILTLAPQDPAMATLIDLGNGVIYSNDSHLYWTKDANLLRTLSRKNPELISQIIAATPQGSIRNKTLYSENGTHKLLDIDFGLVFNLEKVWYDTTTWWGALAFITYLNKIGYGGFHDWRLPTVTPLNGKSFVYHSSNGLSDDGYNNNQPQSELGHLFFAELSNPSQNKKSSTELALSLYDPTQKGPFIQIRKDTYWYAQEYDSAEHNKAWGFSTVTGYQGGYEKNKLHIPWPVRTDPF